MNLQIKMQSWLTLRSPSRPVLSRHVPRWWVNWICPPFSRRQPSAKHLKTGSTLDCNSSDGQSAIVLTSTFALTMPDRSHDEFCKAWQCPVFSSNQMQLAMAGSAESIRIATIESFRASCSKMSNQFQGARRMLLPWFSLLVNVLIRASQTASGYYLSNIFHDCTHYVNLHMRTDSDSPAIVSNAPRHP